MDGQSVGTHDEKAGSFRQEGGQQVAEVLIHDRVGGVVRLLLSGTS
jgi:hypothetical protein